MKTYLLQFADRIFNRRDLGITGTLVLMLAAVLLLVWIVGTFYLSFFPEVAKSAGSANSKTNTALVSAEDSSMTNSENGDLEAVDNASTGFAADSGGTREDFNPGQTNFSQSAADTKPLNDRIARLTKQRDQLENRVEQLEKGSGSNSANLKKLTQLTAERDKLKKQLTSAKNSAKTATQLNQKIKTLKKQTISQSAEIRSLKKELAAAEDARQAAPATAGSSPDPSLEFREWISSKGNMALLAFVRWEDDLVVVVDQSNVEFKLPLHRLSPEDQDYVNSKR